MVVQTGQVTADQFALLLADFLCDLRLCCALCKIQNGKADVVPLPLRFGQHTIFLRFLHGYFSVVLCHTSQNIMAFANVDDFLIQEYRINTRTLVLWGKPLALE